MPAKRKCGRSFSKQESHKIRTRLIEISLKVEDCVYHKMPISMIEAQLYMKEVTAYKHECSKDERSLQVIEKLVRCMKAIIIEHQESGFDDCNECEVVSHVDNNRAASPVYSLPDEDRTHMTQELLEPASVLFDEPTNNIKETEFMQVNEMNSVADNDSNRNSHYCDKSEEDISIVATETTQSAARSKTSTDVEIQKALSNLSLQNVDQEETISTDIEFSQSILNNFHEIDRLQQNHKSNEVSIVTQVVDKAPKIQKKSQAQTIKLYSSKPLIMTDSSRIVMATIVPSSNEPSSNEDLKKKSTNPAIVTETNITETNKVVKATIVPSSNEGTEVLHKTIYKPVIKTDARRIVKDTIVPSTKVMATEDLNKKSNKPANVTDANKIVKAQIFPPSNIMATAEVYNKSSKPVTKPYASRILKATIVPSSNVMATEDLNKKLNIRNPPLLNVPNQNKSVNFPKTIDNIMMISDQSVEQKEFNNKILTNIINNSQAMVYSNNITSTNINATCNSFEQIYSSSTYKKNLETQSKIQATIANNNSSIIVKKKRAPRKNKVTKNINKADNATEKRSSDATVNKIIKPKIRKARSKKVNTVCNLIHKDSTVPIYNNCIENDLSWLENIRFVREVREDEIDSKLTHLSENFWDNYDLPPYFDEGDFL